MKKLTLFIFLLTNLFLNMKAQDMKLVPSVDDSTQMDTIVISTMTDADEAEKNDTLKIFPYVDKGVEMANQGITLSAIVSVIAILSIFGLPMFIIAMVLWFRYKKKQARYRLAAEALAQGKDIPKGLFPNENTPENVLTKGIKNIFLGIGLGVFLNILTGEESIAAIGFLIFCVGLGQVVIAYVTRPKQTDKNDTNQQN